MRLAGELELIVTIDGDEVPLGPDTLERLSVIQSTQLSVPTLEMVFFDHDQFFSNGRLRDGTIITVVCNPNFGNVSNTPLPFRLFNILSCRPTKIGHRIHLTGYANYPALFRELVTSPVTGTSADGVAKIANQIGVPVETDATNDFMRWLPNNKTLGQFLRHLMDHSFAGAGAIMQLAMTATSQGWQLRYKDVAKQILTPPNTTFKSEALSKNIEDLLIEDYDFRSYSGAANGFTGYGSEIVQPDLQGNVNVSNKVDAWSTVPFNIGNVFSDAQAIVRKEILPINMGNTHARFASAKNSNLRNKATFSGHLHCTFKQYVPVKLLDSVSVAIASGYQNEIDQVLSSNYVVLGRTQHVAGQWYREKLHLSRN